MSDYISREAAIEKIRVAAGCAECDGKSGVICCCDFCDIYNAIRLIKSLPTADVEPVRRWIPCSERMPERPGDYQVCTKNEYYGTKNVAKRYFNGDCWSGRWTNITHWMPLPKPPKEGGDGNGLD